MARFEKVLGASNKGIGDLKFVVICTSPRFSELIVMTRNLSYLMKTNNVYNLYVETIFHVDACHYPLYCLTKRHDNEEEDPKLWTSPSK